MLSERLPDRGEAGRRLASRLQGLRQRGAARLVLAVPVAPTDTLQMLAPLVDEIVCLATPEPFRAVGQHDVDFHQLSDEEVIALLRSAR